MSVHPLLSVSRGGSQQKSRSTQKTEAALKLPGIFRCNSIGQHFQPSQFYLKEAYKTKKAPGHCHNISLNQLNSPAPKDKKQPHVSFQVERLATEESVPVYKRKLHGSSPKQQAQPRRVFNARQLNDRFSQRLTDQAIDKVNEHFFSIDKTKATQRSPVKYNELVTLERVSERERVVLHLPHLKLYRLRHYPIGRESVTRQKSALVELQRSSLGHPNILRISKVYWNHPENHYSVLLASRQQVSLQQHLQQTMYLFDAQSLQALLRKLLLPLNSQHIPLHTLQGLDQIYLDDRGDLQLNLVGHAGLSLDELLLSLVAGQPVFSSPQEKQRYLSLSHSHQFCCYLHLCLHSPSLITCPNLSLVLSLLRSRFDRLFTKFLCQIIRNRDNTDLADIMLASEFMQHEYSPGLPLDLREVRQTIPKALAKEYSDPTPKILQAISILFPQVKVSRTEDALLQLKAHDSYHSFIKRLSPHSLDFLVLCRYLRLQPQSLLQQIHWHLREKQVYL